MAEYTMKIELDSSSLARFEQIVKRMEKITVGGGGASSGSGGFSSTKVGLGAGTNDQRKEMQKMFEKLQKFQKDNRLGKFGPGMVKIAGFAIGMAGLVQFRKMLIDSSPMLQAMLTIMNTAITLFLRPIGDMIGFFLKPFVILMLQYGIAFYKKFIDIAPKFTELGEKILAGDWLSAITDWNSLRNSIVAAIFGQGNEGGNDKSALTQQQEIEFADRMAAFEQALLLAEGQWNLFWLKTVPEAWASLETWFNGIPTWWDENIAQPFMNNWNAVKAWFNGIPAWWNSNISQPFLMAWGAINVFFMITIPQVFADMAKSVKNFGTWLWDSFLKPVIDWLQDKFGWIIGIVGGGNDSKTISGTTYGPMQPGISREFTVLEDAYDVIEDDTRSATISSEKVKSDFERFQEFVTTGVQYGGNAVEGIVNGLGTWQSKLQDAIAALGGSGGGSGGPVQQISPYSYNPGQCGGQHGMLITEPITGVGQKSGRTYQFGESGAERVTPSTSSGYGGGEGGNFNATFNIYGVGDVDELERKLEPLMAKWFRDSISRRGIV